MAAGGSQCYTVFGFDGRVDWKPTLFVDGFPETKVCSACGLVSATIALLPCHHTLCHRCYDDRCDRKCNSCPLDKDAFKPEDVVWSTFTSDNLLQRQIYCWNASNGCDALGAVCEIVDHFEKDCQYHAVTCFRCKQNIAYKELSGHLETDCSIPEGDTTSISNGSTDATIAPFAHAMDQLGYQLSSLQTSLQETKELICGQVQVFREREAADMHLAESLQTLDNTLKESTEQNRVSASTTAEELALIRSSTSAITNTLTEFLVLANEIRTSLGTTESTGDVSAAFRNLQQKFDDFTAFATEELGSTGKRLEALEKIAHERLNNELTINGSLKWLNERLNYDVCRNISVLGKAAQVFSELPFCTSEPLLWTVRGWSKLIRAAAIKGEAEALAENPKYFYGYSILPGIRILNNDGDRTLHFNYRVCQGGYDSLLAWPLRKKLRLNVFNDDGNEIARRIIVNTSTGVFRETERPTTARNDPLRSESSMKISDIERNRCVLNDKVSFKFTVSQLD